MTASYSTGTFVFGIARSSFVANCADDYYIGVILKENPIVIGTIYSHFLKTHAKFLISSEKHDGLAEYLSFPTIERLEDMKGNGFHIITVEHHMVLSEHFLPFRPSREEYLSGVSKQKHIRSGGHSSVVLSSPTQKHLDYEDFMKTIPFRLLRSANLPISSPL